MMRYVSGAKLSIFIIKVFPTSCPGNVFVCHHAMWTRAKYHTTAVSLGPLPSRVALKPQLTASGYREVYPLWTISTLASGGLDWTTTQIGQVINAPLNVPVLHCYRVDLAISRSFVCLTVPVS